mmetsp:Transcript_46257/g.100566  ORF Transcript_46257/g.100566 Transcript_46257/m.100566 type:complete len:478 (+) Transcript_46257:123-1556(+)|eukprot:CAMPEP_0170606702 /NCGR_PEP_ID=MMETSP0224-20130122/20656_1 /TAXON_ID=285029 /ORGANISM="Togula jolla, Strain CCCM 725" /LENGTH=477 /DNA_ID=CAMNT_0010931807 /DNA_START=127 /DNA_END=1560 /DNA_ORIENTATION=+
MKNSQDSPPEVSEEKLDKRRLARSTLCCTCLLITVEGMDVQLLPASFRALEAGLGYSPTKLALLAVGQSIAVSFSGPAWANLADSGCSRRILLASGAALWATFTFGLAWTWLYPAMMFLRLLNGCALGMVSPVIQAVVAETSDEMDRGRSFGWITLFERIFGEVTGIVVVTAISNVIYHGIYGWRFAFMFVAVGSMVIASIILLFMEEAPRPWKPENLGLSVELGKLRRCWRIPSFRIIVLQGMFGRIAWSGLGSFGPMYFQYVGVSDLSAGIICGMVILGGGLGGLGGGIIADRLAQWSPNHGRPLAAQLSVGLGILALMLLLCIPRDPSMQVFMGMSSLLLGLVASWCATGCNRPVMLDIVPPDCWASVLAWDVCLERGVGAFIGPLITGLVSDKVFNYQTSMEQVADMTFAQRSRNADALGNSLLLCGVIPWLVTLSIYGLLHRTYAADAALAQQERKAIEDGRQPYGTFAPLD